MNNEAEIIKQLKLRLDEKENVEWGERIEQLAPEYNKLTVADVASLAEDKLRKIWWSDGFAETGGHALPTPKDEQWQGLRDMTASLAERRQSLGARYSAAREACVKTFGARRTQSHVILRSLLILEGGLFGSIATKRYTDIVLTWAGKPELNYKEPTSITEALTNIKALIEEWSPKVGAMKLGERARLPMHLGQIIEQVGGEQGR